MPFRLTVTVWPASAVLVPETIRSDCASAALRMSSVARVLMVTDGAVASTLYSRPADALLPLTLVTLTCTLASPSFRPARSAAGTVAVHLPSVPTVAV